MYNTDLYNKVSDIFVGFLLFTKALAYLNDISNACSKVEESLAKYSKTVRLSKLVLNGFH